MPLLSEVGFGAILQYSSQGTSPSSVKSKTVAHAIKFRAPKAYLDRAAALVAAEFEAGRDLAAFFGSDVIAIPAPRHAPEPPGGGALSVPALICQALRSAGLVAGVEPCLVRRVAVTKSATAGGARPDAQTHYNSLEVAGLALTAPGRILIVDDITTTGATLLACASRVQDARPESDVRTFGLIRSMGRVEVDQIPAPCVGKITLDPILRSTVRRP